jgi:hypothetical protein
MAHNFYDDTALPKLVRVVLGVCKTFFKTKLNFVSICYFIFFT